MAEFSDGARSGIMSIMNDIKDQLALDSGEDLEWDHDDPAAPADPADSSGSGDDGSGTTCFDVTRSARVDPIHPLNFILYGAPGTGKTYSTAEYAYAILENMTVDKLKADGVTREDIMKKYNDYLQAGRIVFTTFHQNYSYEDFIQGLRPDTDTPGLSFKKVDGVFKSIADRALKDTDVTHNYVIIIDEINRANISKVFGELITLIEDDKRWGEKNQMAVTLPSGDPFAVPNNLYIVGTMNSADKSISLIDAALRRRFKFREVQPNPELIDDAALKNVFETLNTTLVSELESTDLLIGHSYFMNKTEEKLPEIFNDNLIPLLYEYFYDDRKKVKGVIEKAITGHVFMIEDSKYGRLKVVPKPKPKAANGDGAKADAAAGAEADAKANAGAEADADADAKAEADTP